MVKINVNTKRDQLVLLEWNRGRDHREIATLLGISTAKVREALFRHRISYEDVWARNNAPIETLICQNPACGKEFRWRELMIARRQGGHTRPKYCSPECSIEKHEHDRLTGPMPKDKEAARNKRFGWLLKRTYDEVKEVIEADARQ